MAFSMSTLLALLPVCIGGADTVLGESDVDVTNSIEYVSDPSQEWQCHHYDLVHDAKWCAVTQFHAGFEYTFSPGQSPCSPCWCCHRKAKQVDKGAAAAHSVSSQSETDADRTSSLPATAETAVTSTKAPAVSAAETHHNNYAKHPIAIDGVLKKAVLAGSGGEVKDGALTMEHNTYLSLFSKFGDNDGWEPENMAQLKLLGKEINFTVDLSRVGCACNLAFYLIAAPARGWDGKPNRGTDRGGQPPYYCDANMVGGQWCPEVDIMEANNHAFQATPHKCDAPVNGYYGSCDRGGCEQNTRDDINSYGPGKSYTINTDHPFIVQTAFPAKSGTLMGMVTRLHQGNREVVLDHSSCDAYYFAALSDAMGAGMSLRVTYWGDKAETMSWMDSPPCGKGSCDGENAGAAVISKISVASVKYVPTTQAPTTEQPEEPKKEKQEDFGKTVDKQRIRIGGVNKAILAGFGGKVHGDKLTISHNGGLTAFTEFKDEWAPDNMLQLKLLGKAISFTVDLSNVGCACNLAFYLISAPGRDWSGQPNPGSNRGGQPPYYCDANMVGGQWCPEVDIMEANNHALQATPHKCDAAINGYYTNCDRDGCAQNTRDRPESYGPGESYTIDTTQPFTVHTEFPEEKGSLLGMHSTLKQAGRHVKLDHSGCDAEYFGMLSDAMRDGMSLRITYWGDKAETMSWMDGPPCARQACSDSAGKGVISNITIAAIPQRVWVVNDENDKLKGNIVPAEIVKDTDNFVKIGNRGVARWRGSTHYVHQEERPAHMELPGLKDCDQEDAESPCDVSWKNEAIFLQRFRQKYLDRDGSILDTQSPGAKVLPILATASMGSIFVALIGLLVTRARRSASQQQMGSIAPPADGSTTGISSMPCTGMAGSCSLGTSSSRGALVTNGDVHMNLPGLQSSGPSCQQLLAKLEAGTD